MPELHLNIWEKTRWLALYTAFLDIGLLLDVRDTASSIELLLPWKVLRSDLEDLSDRIFHQGAVPAIFNEGWELTTAPTGGGYLTDPITKEVKFTVLNAESELAPSVHVHRVDHLPAMTLDLEALRVKSRAIQPNASRMYVRFRVKNVRSHLYKVDINPKDRFLLSSWQRTEIIDFRLNVRRGVPVGLEHSIGRFVEFSKVHLFLMKSRDQDIVFEDAFFRSCRSLEDESFWARYSLPPSPRDWSVWRSRVRVKNSLGYQWTRKAKQEVLQGTTAPTETKSEVANAPVPVMALQPITEFGILARFKTIRFGIVQFTLAVLILGALGNVLWDWVKFRYGDTEFAGKVLKWVGPTLKDGEVKR